MDCFVEFVRPRRVECPRVNRDSNIPDTEGGRENEVGDDTAQRLAWEGFELVRVLRQCSIRLLAAVYAGCCHRTREEKLACRFPASVGPTTITTPKRNLPVTSVEIDLA